jgi:hypothetical protein
MSFYRPRRQQFQQNATILQRYLLQAFVVLRNHIHFLDASLAATIWCGMR